MKKIVNYVLYIFIIIIQFILIFKYNENLYIKKKIKIEKKSIEYVLSKQINSNIKDNKKDNIKDNKKINVINIKKEEIIEYDMILEIPKIKLKKGILNKNNRDNNIEKNVMILKESSYPNETGNIFLAAHSGTGKKSFFNNLSKLSINDKAILYYKEKKYIYIVTKIYESQKKNTVLIRTDSNNNLFLITCSQKNKSNFLIIELKKTEI